MIELILKYEDWCESCEGKGWEWRLKACMSGRENEEGSDWVPCYCCGGSGVCTTQTGDDLAAFLHDHYGLEFKNHPMKEKPNWSPI